MYRSPQHDTTAAGPRLVGSSETRRTRHRQKLSHFCTRSLRVASDLSLYLSPLLSLSLFSPLGIARLTTIVALYMQIGALIFFFFGLSFWRLTTTVINERWLHVCYVRFRNVKDVRSNKLQSLEDPRVQSIKLNNVSAEKQIFIFKRSTESFKIKIMSVFKILNILGCLNKNLEAFWATDYKCQCINIIRIIIPFM